MTHDKYEELHFLKVLLDRTDSPERWYTYDDLILAVRTGKMTADRAEELFLELRRKECIDQKENLKKTSDPFYIISDMGRWYQTHLEIEELRDSADLKLKSISIDNIKITRLIAIWALVISAAGFLVQATKVGYDIFKPPTTTQIKFDSTEMLLQRQYDLIKNLDSIKAKLLQLDTSTKKVKVIK